MVVPVGATSAKDLLETKKTITEIQGVLQWSETHEHWVLPTWHPAYILRNPDRAEELINTGADRVATACPFCYIMLDDGVKGAGAGEEVAVSDIAITVLDAIENGERKIDPSALGSGR